VNQNGTAETASSLKGKDDLRSAVSDALWRHVPISLTGPCCNWQDLLNKARATQVEIVGIDVDPYRDTQARLDAYVKLIGRDFQLWREVGDNYGPDLTRSNSQLRTRSERRYQPQPERDGEVLRLDRSGRSARARSCKPDWMAPHAKLTYDITHSDGFWSSTAPRRAICER